ncbi:MAG: hypothetical protein JRE07_00540 [Deltaproteobacteria bacterium]|nr:hypothetical protein [Deltaproteobacteria bacterium]MBW1825879.1 hypothetical protein [Deltaproteobacteria bacterium]MBW2197125.1 hypothetical protein [Deltaproteobacteria bacterium]MBW2226882.1 hypothetical protein [Deltaproteobacteria bacterium]MBW2555383.1 hypothetical protein [Deltaproteobacteria bacterium]
MFQGRSGAMLHVDGFVTLTQVPNRFWFGQDPSINRKSGTPPLAICLLKSCTGKF